MFLNPWMLIAVAGIAGPILVHLLNRRRIQRIPWAAMRFLHDAVKQNQRRMNFEDLLLLILRCLIVALIALAMSRPAVRSAFTSPLGQSTVTAAIVIDNSASTALSDGTISRFDQSKRTAQQIVSTMPRGSSVAVYLASDVITPLIAEPTTDLALVTATIEQARRSDRSSDLLPAINSAIDLLQRQPAARKELYVLTDAQASAFAHAAEICDRLKLAAKSVHATFVTNTLIENRNLAVTGLSLDSTQIPSTTMPLGFDVQVTNSGSIASACINVRLSVDGKPASAQALLPAIPPGQSRGISLATAITSDGFHTVTASIPHDHMPADDQRTIAIHVVKQLRILIVTQDKPDQPPSANSAFFLRHALTPVPAAELANYAVRVSSIFPEQLDTARLSDDAIVALVDMPAPSASATATLAHYVAAGGGLMIFPGPGTNAPEYNDRLGAMLLPATFGALRGDTDGGGSVGAGATGGGSAALSLQADGYANPIVSLWSDPSAGTLTSARFYRSYQLVPVAGTAASSVTTVLKFSNNSPAIVSRRIGRGEVMLFASSADTQWNDLPVHPAFVPLLQRIVGELAQRADANLNLRVGDPYTLQTAAELTGKDATILEPEDASADTNAGKTAAIKDASGPRQMARIDLRNGVPTLSFADTNLAGVYTVRAGGKSTEPLALFATQPDPAESDLTPASPQTRQMIALVATVLKCDDGADIAGTIRTNRIGRELWLFLGSIALVLSATELFLSNRFSQPK